MSVRVIDILNSTYDPLTGLNAEGMGLKPTIIEKDNLLAIHFIAGFPVKPCEKGLLPALQHAFEQHLPGVKTELSIESFIKPHQTQLPGMGLRGVKNTIAIASGKGGVGKSTVTINLATALAKAGARVGILDADIYGPSIPMMLGAHAPVAMRDEHYLPVRAHGIDAMSMGYLTDNNQALIWRGPMLAKSLIQMLDMTLWDHLDYLFIDLPPGTGDIQLSLVQKIPLTAAVIVTTPQNIATLDAQKAIKMFETTRIDAIGLVENMSWHHCQQCGHQDTLFGHGGAALLSNTFSIPILGQLPLTSRIRQECDEGLPVAMGDDALADVFMKTAMNLAIALAKKPLNYAGKFPPVVVE